MRFFVTDGISGLPHGSKRPEVSSENCLKPTVWAVLISKRYGRGLPFLLDSESLKGFLAAFILESRGVENAIRT